MYGRETNPELWKKISIFQAPTEILPIVLNDLQPKIYAGKATADRSGYCLNTGLM
jgi:hypothetical protein